MKNVKIYAVRAATLAAAGVGAAALLKKKSQNEATSHSESAVRKDPNYRNTELGKHEKTKGDLLHKR